ncbi:MAG: TRAP transporter large permease [Propionivibrio sp.]
MILTVFIVFLVLTLLHMPIAFAIGISATLFFVFEPNLMVPIAVQRMVAGTQSFPLLAIPFFILAGHLTNASGVTSRLIDFADALMGHIAGGIAQVSVLLSLFMGGLSGSSNADVAMETRMLLPKMRERGYGDGFSTAVIAYSSLAVAIIPPSIGLILYGFVGQVSIERLFIAGIIPGILMSLVTIGCIHIIATSRGYDSERKRSRRSFADVVRTFLRSFWALLFPVLLVLTIRFGIFTPTEVGAFAVFYTLFVGMFVYREMTYAKFKHCIEEAVVDIGVIMLIIAMASIISYVLAYGRVPFALSSFLTTLPANSVVKYVAVIALLLFAGTIVEGSVLILLLTPILLPVVRDLGMDPVQFGIVMAIVIQIGGVTPPVGVNMYTVCSIADVPIGTFLRDSWIFFAGMLLMVALTSVWPQLSLGLPTLLLD